MNGAKITFNTKDDDKDGDTTVDIRVDGTFDWPTAEAAARDSGNYEHFLDNTSYTIPLQISRFLVTRRMLLRGQLVIHITPHGGLGDDEWKFTFSLDFTFTNGESMHLDHPDKITMNQNENEKRFDIHSLI